MKNRSHVLAIIAAAAMVPAGLWAQSTQSQIESARSLVNQSFYRAALDKYRLVDRESLDEATRRELALSEARCLYALACYTEAETAYRDFIRLYPTAPELLQARVGYADCLVAQGRDAEAFEAFEALDLPLLDRDSFGKALCSKGIAALALGKTDIARRAFNEAADIKASRQTASFFLGRLNYEMGDFKAARANFEAAGSKIPQAEFIPFYTACIEYGEGNYSKAATLARRLIAAKSLPENMLLEAERIAGESLFKTKRAADGRPLLEHYIATAPNPAPSALFVMGCEQFENGRFAQALASFKPVAEHGKGSMRQAATVYYGVCQYQTGMLPEALETFKIAAADSSSAELQEAAAFNLAAMQCNAQAAPFASVSEPMQNFLKSYPSGNYAHRAAKYLAKGYYADKDYERALTHLRSIKDRDSEDNAAMLRVLLSLSNQYLAQDRTADARKLVGEAVKVPKVSSALDAELLLTQGMLAQAENRHKDAADIFQDYISTYPKSANKAFATYRRAYALHNNGQSATAAPLFEQASRDLKDLTARADAANRRGDILSQSGKYKDAVKAFEYAYSLNPKTGDYALLQKAVNKGYTHDFKEKLKVLDQFFAEFPTSALTPDALLERTQALISLGKNEQAVETYQKLINQYPKTSQGRRGYLQMAMTLLDLGRNTEAAEAYREVIRLYPTSEEASQASSLLKALMVDQGRGEEYLDFISSVDGKLRPDAGERESTSFESAMRQYESKKGTKALESFVERFPNSQYTPQALSVLMENAADESSAQTIAARIVEQFPDSKAAEKALLYQAENLYKHNALPEALQKWKALAAKGSTSAMVNRARLGMMRTARDMGDNELAMETADAILSTTTAAEAHTEAKFTKAAALNATDKTAEALNIWKELAGGPVSDIFTARSAFEGASALAEEKKYDKAIEMGQKLVQSSSPHRYWVARTFILMSDVYTAQGKKTLARDYLQALRDNYPGTDADIFMMIDSRLNNN